WVRVPCEASNSTLLRAVAGTSLLTVLHGLGVECTTDDLVTDTGKVLHTTTAHQHERVLLQVVALTRDVSGHLGAVAELHTSDLAHRRVRLLRGGGVHAGAHAGLLRVRLQSGRLGLRDLGRTSLANQLLNSWHVLS